MTISVNPMTFVVTIPQADLTPVSGTLYELDVNDLRLWCHDWMDDQAGGISHLKMFTHNTEYTVAGVTYARAVIFLPPYSFTFEDGQYSVRLSGANTNLFDVENGILNQNQVQVIAANSAGLVAFPTIEAQVDELHKLQGLDSDNPMTVTPTSRVAGDIDQTISGDGETTSTVTRN